MALLYASEVSPRFSGDDLDPAAISAALGQKPTLSYSKGATFLTPKGQPVVGRTGLWSLQVGRSLPADPDSQVAKLLAPLTGDLDIWRRLTRQFAGELFFGLFVSGGNEGVHFSAKTVMVAADRGLKIDFDIYNCGGD